MPRSILLSFLLCLTPLLSAQRLEGVAPITCPFTEEEMTIDGALTEAIWDAAEPVSFSLPVTHAEPSSETVGRICWDDKCLYVAFDGRDEDLRGVRTERESDVFRDDVFETFLQPGAERGFHHNIEINLLGTVLDQQTPGLSSAWNCDGLEIGIVLDGTLNDSTDRDRGWRMEIAIPFESLEPRGEVRPEVGDTWSFHLSRYDYSRHLANGRELSSTAPLTRVNFHFRPDWSMLRFER